MPKAAPRNPGLLSVDELRKRVASGDIDTVIVGFTDHYGRLVGKRFDATFFLDSALKNGAEACNYLLAVDMEMNPVAGYTMANWELGFGDFHLRPDLGTLRVAAWLDRSALVLCDVERHATHEPIVQAPRSVLRKQIARAAKLGFTAMAGSELEYYLYQNSYRDAATKPFEVLQPAGWYLEDYHMLQGARTEPYHSAARRALAASGVPVETSKGEWGKGQHELNIRYAEVLEMADRHVIFKQCLKELADRMGVAVTFMAKIDQAQAGSSCHMHLSLWRGARSAFAGKNGGSETFRHFLGGWLAHARELMPFFAPTVNSYKRYQSLSWAPTRIAWSHDNRTAGFRIVGEGESLRIECRIPGADANPYLAYAAALAAGLAGIERRIEPPKVFNGDMYAAGDLPRVPLTLREATELLSRSEFAREAFGDDVVDHYLHFARTEQEAFDAAVTDWERKRYFERI